MWRLVASYEQCQCFGSDVGIRVLCLVARLRSRICLAGWPVRENLPTEPRTNSSGVTTPRWLSLSGRFRANVAGGALEIGANQISGNFVRRGRVDQIKHSHPHLLPLASADGKFPLSVEFPSSQFFSVFRSHENDGPQSPPRSCPKPMEDPPEGLIPTRPSPSPDLSGLVSPRWPKNAVHLVQSVPSAHAKK
jgi:hypothetical protein